MGDGGRRSQLEVVDGLLAESDGGAEKAHKGEQHAADTQGHMVALAVRPSQGHGVHDAASEQGAAEEGHDRGGRGALVLNLH